MTPRKLVFYWSLYGLTALLLILLQSWGLLRLRFGGVHPFLLPCIAVMTAVYVPRKGGCLFAFFLGFLCDMLFPGAIPCLYVLVFPLCAFGAGFLSRRFLTHGFLCSAVVCAGSVLLTALAQMFFLSFRSQIPLSSGLHLLSLELLMTVPFVLLLHPLYSRIDRFLATV